jgi:hypothetical protein
VLQQRGNQAILPTRTNANTFLIRLCQACQFAKAKKQPDRATNTKKVKDGVISDGILQPGQMVSSDQFVSSSKGRLTTSKGKEPDSQKYTGGTIFYNHASGFIFVVSQVSLGAAETIHTKHAFEREVKICGVTIEHYHEDNGVLKTNEFKKDFLDKQLIMWVWGHTSLELQRGRFELCPRAPGQCCACHNTLAR